MGRPARHGFGAMAIHCLTPPPPPVLLEQAEKDGVLLSAEAGVPEAGGDLSTPPPVSPFPNWAEDSDEMVGSRVRVYWDGDNEWYSGRIVRFKAAQPKPYLVRYGCRICLQYIYLECPICTI